MKRSFDPLLKEIRRERVRSGKEAAALMGVSKSMVMYWVRCARDSGYEIATGNGRPAKPWLIVKEAK